ncbi:hypothetical protein CCACVL1_10779 [Corchorus capsularis]|uniref:Uncharacterized protein n=1 Tax=Corchorus capsularis TaxID=210143 RepID=A0A1R3IPP2_COCAP|nr:hypothetical protein CCACVL1_10779 [Corchorus capsularis]
MASDDDEYLMEDGNKVITKVIREIQESQINQPLS